MDVFDLRGDFSSASRPPSQPWMEQPTDPPAPSLNFLTSAEWTHPVLT